MLDSRVCECVGEPAAGLCHVVCPQTDVKQEEDTKHKNINNDVTRKRCIKAITGSQQFCQQLLRSSKPFDLQAPPPSSCLWPPLKESSLYFLLPRLPAPHLWWEAEPWGGGEAWTRKWSFRSNTHRAAGSAAEGKDFLKERSDSCRWSVLSKPRASPSSSQSRRHGSGEEGYRSHPSHTFFHDVGELEHEPETQKTCVHPDLLQPVKGYLEYSALKFDIWERERLGVTPRLWFRGFY